MTDDRAKRQPHPAAFCIIRPGDNFFSGRMARHSGGWVPRYTCPACGRQMRMPSNYLGGNKLVCTGERFWKPHEQTIGNLGRENIGNLFRLNDLHLDRLAQRDASAAVPKSGGAS